MRTTFFIAIISLVRVGLAQQEEIDQAVQKIDNGISSVSFVETSFEDETGNRILIRSYSKGEDLLKLISNSSNLRNRRSISFYFSSGQLIFVSELTSKIPGLPSWEEAKSNDLGLEEVDRVKQIDKKELAYYFRNGKIFKTEPKSDMDLVVRAEELEREAYEFLQRLN